MLVPQYAGSAVKNMPTVPQALCALHQAQEVPKQFPKYYVPYTRHKKPQYRCHLSLQNIMCPKVGSTPCYAQESSLQVLCALLYAQEDPI